MLKRFEHLQVFRFAVLAILFSFISISAVAQNYQLDGSYYLRSSSSDFLSQPGMPGNNIVGSLQKGSTFRVVNRIPKSNGAEALEIEITAMSRGSKIVSESENLFIYKPARTDDFIKRGSSNVQAGVANCENCGETAKPESTTVLTRFSDTVTRLANKAPEPEKIEKDEIAPHMGPTQSGSLDKQITNYSNSTQVSRMIDWAMKNKNGVSRGICYRMVKEAIANKCGPNIIKDKALFYRCKNAFAPEGGKSGPGNNLTSAVSTEWADSYALSAKTRLKKDGFINLMEIEPYKSQMRTPTDAPKGAILVYSSGIPCYKGKVRDCGHAEIKTGNPGQPGYVSDYYSADAINETPNARKHGSNYKLVGIMIKPKDTP